MLAFVRLSSALRRRAIPFSSITPSLLRFSKPSPKMPPRRTASKRKASESPVDSEDSPPGSDFEEKPKKKTKASAKRKAAASDDEAGPSNAKGSKSKKAKTTEDTENSETAKGLAPNGQPTNKVLPVHIELPPRDDNVLRIATWNICGLAASSKKVRVSSLFHASDISTFGIAGLQVLRRGGRCGYFDLDGNEG